MQIELGIAIAIGSFVIGYFTFSRNRDKDVRLSAAEDTTSEVDMGHLAE